jgi:outer membrane protein TolC
MVEAGCTVGPKYQRAAAPVPAKWDVAEPWRDSVPKDGLAKGEWWGVFRDDDLSALEKQALDANQTIKVAAARLEQARASAAVQIATQFPTFSTSPSVQRQSSFDRQFPGDFPCVADQQCSAVHSGIRSGLVWAAAPKY